ncbi:MAG: DUF4422 domain-containing protein [Rickettsiales bacterium]|jgi:hypothetical protein|nr:DUF4422 domain-containing protein [Rickettsiales bacterium]
MNKYFVRFICFFIFNKKKRHAFRKQYSTLTNREFLERLQDRMMLEGWKYDTNDKLPNCKIIMCYHKPAQLFQHKLIFPIHSGRGVAKDKSKDGVVNEIAHKWLLDNMVGDDTGDNISHLNRWFNELTGIYWAWKHYDKIGNPDYIGVFHYRRLFTFDMVYEIANYDLIVPKDRIRLDRYGKAINLVSMTGDKGKLEDVIKKIKPDFTNKYKEYLKSDELFARNMFIMKKEMFFEYCEIIFPIMMEVFEKYGKNATDPATNMRIISSTAETITGAFLYAKIKEGFKYKQYKWIFSMGES